MRVWCGVIFLAAYAGCAQIDHELGRSQSVLTIGVPESMAAGTGFGLRQLTNIFTVEGLTQTYTNDGRAVPRLAESWEWEDGGKRLRLRLRANVMFHNGAALTSEVAADALSRAIALPANRALYPSVTAIKAVRPDGERQVLLDLSQPSAFLPEDLELPLSNGADGIGTGAFRLVKIDGSGAELERFDHYYQGIPRIERIVIRASENLRMSWSRLLRGEVDMVTDVPPEAVEFIQNDDIRVISFPRSYQFLIAFNSRNARFRSALVRRALNAAIDRDALITRVLQGHGEPATSPIWPHHWAYDTSVPPFRFDPRGAVSLLETAGFTLPRTASNPQLPPARLRFTCLMPSGFSLLEPDWPLRPTQEF